MSVEFLFFRLGIRRVVPVDAQVKGAPPFVRYIKREEVQARQVGQTIRLQRQIDPKEV